MQWPKTETGAVDWETAFEDPAKGFIALVKAARTPAKTRKITAVLVSALFLPGSAPPKRAEYRAALADILAEGKPAETVQPDAVALLRTIKKDRIAAEEAGAVSAPPAGDGWEDPTADLADDEEEEDGGGGYENEDASGGAAGANPHVLASPEYLMGVFFLRQYEERLKVLHEGVTEDFPSPPPYLVSRHFAARFNSVLMNRFADRVIDANYVTVRRCDVQAPEKRVEFMEKAFEDINERRRFFESWKKIWAEKTEQQRPPKKPETPKQTGVLSKLAGKRNEGGMSIEEWEAAAAETERKNETAREICAEISAESPDYLAPAEEDLKVLMNLLGRTPTGLEKQITAISQIGLQSRSTSAFDRYQQGRPVDLPLLAASFRHPAAFLGPKGFTRDLMRGYRQSARAAAFPLVSRFIIDAEYEVYTPKTGLKSAGPPAPEYGGDAAYIGEDGPKDWEPISDDLEED